MNFLYVVYRCLKSGLCSQFHFAGLTPGMRLDSEWGWNWQGGAHRERATDSHGQGSREPITSQTRVACKLDRGLGCCPRGTVINGADCLRSPSPAPSPLSWRFLTKKRNEGELATEDRRKGRLCPTILNKAARVAVPAPGERGRQRHMPKCPVMLGSRPRAKENLNCATG